jgi:hypothetical protein
MSSREALRSAGVALAIAIVTLAALEILLRVVNFRELRAAQDRRWCRRFRIRHRPGISVAARLWPNIERAVVVLMFCTQTDRQDKSTNIRYEGCQKPCFATTTDRERRQISRRHTAMKPPDNSQYDSLRFDEVWLDK